MYSSRLNLTFNQADLGGTLFYEGYLDDFRTTVPFQIPVPTS